MHKPLTHKKKGLPGILFLYKSFRHKLNQRFKLEFVTNDKWDAWFKEIDIDVTKPVYINAIFRGFWKRGDPIKGSLATGPIKIWLRFTGLIFEQDGKQYRTPFSRNNRREKRGEWEFEVTNFKNFDWGKEVNIPELVTQADGSNHTLDR